MNYFKEIIYHLYLFLHLILLLEPFLKYCRLLLFLCNRFCHRRLRSIELGWRLLKKYCILQSQDDMRQGQRIQQVRLLHENH